MHPLRSRLASATIVIPLVILTLAPSACGGPDVEASDVGKLCVYATAPANPGANSPAQSFASEKQIHVSVTLDNCLSACIRNELASCSVAQQGQRLIISSGFSYDDPAAGEACIALCNSLSAVCQTGPLAAGNYVIEHGDDEYALSVPSKDVPPCL